MKTTLLSAFTSLALAIGLSACGGANDPASNPGAFEGNSSDEDAGPGCVEVCHIPQGNPDNAHTICVGEAAVSAHVGRHGGDFLGRCDVCEFRYHHKDHSHDDDSDSESDSDSSGHNGEVSECALACQDACEDSTDPDRAQQFDECLERCEQLALCEEGCCGVARSYCEASEPADPKLCEQGYEACLRGAGCLFCGDGYVDQLTQEECDDGNNDDGDGCDGMCRLES